MAANNGLTTTASAQVALPWEEKMDLVRGLCPTASPQEFGLFLHQAKRTGLDPLARQIYLVTRGGKGTIQTGIDGFRLIAERSGAYEGQTKTEWCGEDGKWVDVWLKNVHPHAARVGIHKTGFREALYAVALWTEYKAVGPMWDKMPALMLGKCAEALALRKAFPQDLSGLYTSDEMAQAESAPAKAPVPYTVKPKAVSQDLVEAEVIEPTEAPKAPKVPEPEPAKPVAKPEVAPAQAWTFQDAMKEMDACTSIAEVGKVMSRVGAARFEESIAQGMAEAATLKLAALKGVQPVLADDPEKNAETAKSVMPALPLTKVGDMHAAIAAGMAPDAAWENYHANFKDGASNMAKGFSAIKKLREQRQAQGLS